MAKKIKISGVVITFNEERYIAQCIRSLQNVTDEVVVVDSLSTDKTKDICLEMGVRFIEQPFLGYVEQKNFALDQSAYQYVLSLDADEMLSDELIEVINKLKDNWDADGYVFNRYNNYCGKWLKYSFYPDAKLRLWDKQKGRWGGTNPHDKVLLEKGAKIKRIKKDILHFAYRDIGHHMEQVKRFAQIASDAKMSNGQKVNFWSHVVLSPPYMFFKIYFLKLGFLDGYYGFVFSAMYAYLSFLKYARLWELQRKSD